MAFTVPQVLAQRIVEHCDLGGEVNVLFAYSRAVVESAKLIENGLLLEAMEAGSRARLLIDIQAIKAVILQEIRGRRRP